MNTRPNDKIKNILLAVDGSEHSRAAVSLLHDLSIDNSTCPDCLITIVGVLNPLDSATHSTYKPPLYQAQALLEQRGFQVKVELILGYPAEILIQYAAENHPELIVLGAKGLRATLGILLGGVAQQVVEYAKCPVLIVRAPYKPLKHILLVTDGSSSSIQAAHYLNNFPMPKQADLTIAHVLRPHVHLEKEFLIQTWSLTNDAISYYQQPDLDELQSIREEEEKHGRTILDRTEQELASSHLPRKTALLQGDAATEIINYSKAYDIDLIVAGSRGLSEMKAWMLGSVSRKLVHYANCSMLIVRR
jgi:nucleotide-binding universal stress UspA family protein